MYFESWLYSMYKYKIDQETVRKILETADIVDVVSDFVSLKRRGANYIGLCPFHNERTPSFSVSKSKGICKCFSCGKGGSPVNFIMLHEQMSYQEALRYLAKKYNIEIKEHEMTDKEREEATERESMLAVNEFAMLHFENNLLETAEGQNIGQAYFRERGINNAMIHKFRLGYAIDRRDDLLSAARKKGYGDKYLFDTGLIGRSERNEYYDRFRGRVIYPVFSISGKVVAFGGRTLRTDKVGGKYVNSPESIIYSKSRELYGLYQAKPAIVKKDKCILVEGYMDVISMFQNGIENVVASSGTSLTDGQIRLIHRFTENITVIYDSDAAGIKASLRGIDMLLAEGMNVKVLQLPEGDDPDSFSQSHSAIEVEEYLDSHETDFIKFKTDILLKGVKNDPIQRSRVISDIVRSIAVIPNEISRNIYIKECAYSLDIDERVLANEISKCIVNIREQEYKKKKNAESENNTIESRQEISVQTENIESSNEEENRDAYSVSQQTVISRRESQTLEPYEREVLRFVVKYGMRPIDGSNADDSTPYRIIDFIREELDADDIKFSDANYAHLFSMAIELCDKWNDDELAYRESCRKLRVEEWERGQLEIQNEAANLKDITAREQQLKSQCDDHYRERIENYATNYIERILSSSPDDIARHLTIDLVTDKHILSKIHTKYARVEEEKDILNRLVPRAIYDLRNAILQNEIQSINEQIKNVYINNPADLETISMLMKKLAKMKHMSTEFAKLMGDRVIMPQQRR